MYALGRPNLGQRERAASVLADDQIKQEMIALLPRLRRFAYGLTGSQHEGDDLVQDTCERAIRNLDKWQAGTRLDSWMFQIARNLFLNRVRDNAVRRKHLQVVMTEDPTAHASPPVAEARLTLEAVRRAIWQLPEEQRAVLLLISVEGLSYKETAAALDIPMGTVMSRLARGRAVIKAMIEEAPAAELRQLARVER